MRRTAAAVLFVLALALGAASPAAAQNSFLQVATTGVGASVQIDPPGLLQSCEFAFCSYRYPTGTTVRLTATPSEQGSALAAWAGGCPTATPTCDVVVDANKTVIVRFTPVRLYADRQRGRGSVAVNPVGATCGAACWLYASGTSVTLTATPAPGWVFDRWAGMCSTITAANVCTNALVADAEALQEFDCEGCTQAPWPARGVPITRTRSGPGYLAINNRRCVLQTCTRVYSRFRALSVRAYPQGSRRFLGWAGRGCSGTAVRCQFDALRNLAGQRPVIIARFG